ncbi:MAG: hypothetical protein ACR2NU_03835, partial [Aeoliella sp.]
LQDTARFNLVADYTVSFIQGRQTGQLQVLNGDVTFQGSGITPGDRTLEVIDALVNNSGDLILTPGAGGHGMILSTTDDMTVRGTLEVNNGAQLLNTRALVESALSNSQARLFISGVSSTGARSTWNATSLDVGDTDNGEVQVDDGGLAFIAGPVTLGGASGSDGEIVVTGANSSSTASDFRSTGTITIGDAGNGEFRVENGAFASNGGAILGDQATGRGTVTLESNTLGDPAFWIAGILNVKRGDVMVNRGGLLRTFGATIGGEDTSSMTVSGAGTGSSAGLWEAQGVTTISSSADATLDIFQGGTVNGIVANVGRVAGGVGRINVSGSNPAQKSRWLQTGDLYLGGDEFGIGGVGHLNLISDSFARVEGTTTIYANSSIVMGPGSQLLAPTIDNSNGGFFDFLRGTLNTKNYTGDLVNQEGTLAPYRSSSQTGEGIGITNVDGNYTQQSGATLEIEMDGEVCGIGYDHLNVIGNATLGGDLVLTLLDDFVPDPIMNFTIVAADSLGGQFANAAPGTRITTTDGIGSFLINYGSNSPFNADHVILTDFLIIPDLPGDYNNDEIVDAADYTVWRDNLGASITLPNDVTPGMVTEADYLVWTDNFGEMLVAGSLQAAAVPEPCTAYLLAIAALAVVSRGLRNSAVAQFHNLTRQQQV